MRAFEATFGPDSNARAASCARAQYGGTRTASTTRQAKEFLMLYWAVVFFCIAMVAAFLGFFGIASASAAVAKILFFIFLVMAVVSFLVGRRPAV
jgi:uncharacterized membrane protein YtjA (UPF0391 family)